MQELYGPNSTPATRILIIFFAKMIDMISLSCKPKYKARVVTGNTGVSKAVNQMLKVQN